MLNRVNPRVAGLAAIAGGSCWVVKSTVILATGDQPPLLFGLAPLLFAVGVLGLWMRVGAARGIPAAAGVLLAGVGALASVVALIVTSGGTEVTSAQEFSPPIFLSFVATLLALLLVGIDTWRNRSLRPNWHMLAVWLFVSFFPLLVIGGLLETVNERLLEVPLLVLGFGWMLLGYAIVARPNNATAAPSA